MFYFSEIIRPKPKGDSSSIPSLTEPSTSVHPEYDASLRGRIFYTLEDANYSYLATALAWIQMVIVLTSVVTFMVGTLPQYWASTPLWLRIMEWIFGIYFTVDYLLRLFTARVWYRWIYQPFPVIDLVSTAPFWIDLILKGIVKRLAVLRVLRLLRVFRVIRAAKAAVYVKILVNTLKNSRDALLLLLFVIAILVSLFASVMFFAEQTGQKFNKTEDQWRRFDGSVSPFQSIFHCMWWAIVTITTTGYGDTYPVTLAGKIVAGMCMLAGVTMIAFPIAVLGNNFSQAWNDFQTKKAQKKALQKRDKASKGSKPNSVLADEPRTSVDLDAFPMNEMGAAAKPLVIDVAKLSASEGAAEAPAPANHEGPPTEPVDATVIFNLHRESEVRETLKRLKMLLNSSDLL